MKPKVKDIAERAGVSQATVSLVLNNKSGYSGETKRRVLEVVEQMGYTSLLQDREAYRDKGALSLVVYRKHGKLVNVPSIFDQMLEGAVEAARTRGYQVSICYFSEKENGHETLRSLADSPPKGILLSAVEMVSADLKPFLELGLPMATIGNPFDGQPVDSVCVDNEGGAALAAAHLIEMGHRDIGFIHGLAETNNFRAREEGLRRTLREAGIDLPASRKIGLDPPMEAAYRDMLGFISGGGNLPGAIFAENDFMALGAVRAIKESGYRIPEDISIVGFDNLALCGLMEPELSSVGWSFRHEGLLAVRRLADIIETGDREHLRILIRPELVKRKSVRKVETRTSAL